MVLPHQRDPDAGWDRVLVFTVTKTTQWPAKKEIRGIAKGENSASDLRRHVRMVRVLQAGRMALAAGPCRAVAGVSERRDRLDASRKSRRSGAVLPERAYHKVCPRRMLRNGPTDADGRSSGSCC